MSAFPLEGSGEIYHQRFLPDLIDLILSFLADKFDSKANFAQYALVSKDWIHPSRKHLFRSVVLHVTMIEAMLVGFTQFLVETPHMSNYIQSLHIYPYQDKEGVVSIQRLANLLRLLPRLTFLDMSNLFIMSNANAQPQEPHPFHLELASFDVLIARPSPNSSPLHDLFNLFSSIKKLHANRFTFNIGELQFPLDRRVSISQFSYDSDGELETGIIDELVPILFRDIINPSSVKTIHAWLPMIDDLEDMSQLIDKTFKFMDGPLSIDFTLSSRDADSSMEVEYETQRSHIPLSPAVTAATYTLQLSGEDDDQEYFDTVVNKYLSQHPPNIRSFTLEIETDGDLTNEENIELFQTFEWSDFGQTMHEWGTLEHLEIMISLGKYEQGLDVQVRELRDAIMEEMEPAKDILKSVTIRFL